MATNREITLTGPGSAEALISGSYLSAYVTAIQWSPEVPTTGTLDIYYRASDDEPWRKFRAGVQDYTNGQQPVNASAKGHVISQMRVVTEGTPAGSTVTVRFYLQTYPDTALDERVYGGSMAINTQDTTAANILQGKQFFLRTAYPMDNPIPALETRKIHLTVGDSPVLVFLRIFEYIGEELVLRLFASPQGVTGGTPITISNWNTVNPQTSVSTATKDVTTTDDGIEIIEPEYFFGGETVSSRSVTSIPENRNRVIPANSDFILAITNNNGQSARCQYFLDWYEGDLATDL